MGKIEERGELWEFLVPKKDNNGIEFSIAYHNRWDNAVREISGGITIMRSAKGVWTDTLDSGRVYEERVIPVRVICKTEDEVKSILNFTKNYYNQIAVMAYKVSERVIIYS